MLFRSASATKRSFQQSNSRRAMSHCNLRVQERVGSYAPAPDLSTISVHNPVENLAAIALPPLPTGVAAPPSPHRGH